MRFEFDRSKSLANKLKHGIDFMEVQKLWLDETLIEIPAHSLDETRSMVIGVIDGRHWSAVVTYRGRRIRLISARRTRDEEVAIHEGR